MRDIALIVFVLGLVPVILKYPWVGVLAYAWVSIFAPHRWTYGIAYNFPFAMIVAAATLVSMGFHRKEVRLPMNSTTIILVLLPCWMTVTLVFAFDPVESFTRWIDIVKVFLFVVVTAALLHTRRQLEALLWVLVISIGFYGIKGGLFTILTGGGQKVYGPEESFIADNNAIAVAIVMTIPLLHYLSTTVSSKWIKFGLYGSMFLSSVAVLGSQSRGAFLAIAAMTIFLWLKSQKKMLLGVVLLILVPIGIGFMPQTWTTRMESTKNYEEDASAQGRFNAWHMAFNLANDRPIVGGGFEIYNREVFARYAPDPNDVHSAHSIYFQILGEHGYVGLALFLSLGIVSWVTARRIISESRDRVDEAWGGRMARAIQVSFIGFAVGGAFVNIAYWDVQYYEIIVLMATYRLVHAVERGPDQRVLKPKRTVALT
jgi:putative inorganic carbon (HCO3(-)) transporter